MSHRRMVRSANCMLAPLDPTSIGVLNLDNVPRVEFLEASESNLKQWVPFLLFATTAQS